MSAKRVVLICGALISALLTSACGSLNSYPAAPQVAASPDHRYRIGPLDTLNIVVWRNPELSTTVSVRPDGRISTPLVEDMQAVGKTPTQLARDLEAALANGAAASPAVIAVCTKPGRTMSTDAPEPSSASDRPWANPSSPALVDPYTKLALRTRSPATDDSTTSVPWPWARRRRATGRQVVTAAV